MENNIKKGEKAISSKFRFLQNWVRWGRKGSEGKRYKKRKSFQERRNVETSNSA